MQAYLILANGRILKGKSLGCQGTTVGEVVFATGMVGFEETLTDPSYYGQIITQTYPLIGNYGMNSEDKESGKIWAKGYIVREACTTPSNFRSEETLDTFLKENGIIGIEGIDTRSLTRILRESGVMNGAITTEFDPETEPEKLAALMPIIKAYAVTGAVDAVTCTEPQCFAPTAGVAEGEEPLHIALLDLGCKKNIVRCLCKRGCRVTVLPASTTLAELKALAPDGLMLSNGPGDPAENVQVIANIRDMLDTGIDVPEVLNLVFFKKVMSKAKFWQMIGRGTRLCPGLLDGEDKQKFYIFDFCGNFEFFRMNDGKPTANLTALQGAIFHLKSEIAFKLQDLAYQTPELIQFRATLVEDTARKVRELNRENFAVRQHLKYVELYSDPGSYQALTYEDTLVMGRELSPLIQPEEDDPKALRFDALMYGIELAYLAGKSYSRRRSDLLKKVSAVASVANIPEIMAQADLIDKILHTPYLESAGINEFEHIRQRLRDLMKYIPIDHARYDTNFDDEILSQTWNESELENDDLKNYRAAAEFYIRQHQDNAAIAKLKSNVPLTAADVKELERILWSEVGTEAAYHKEFGDKPLGVFVREIVGLDMSAAKAAFAEYIDEARLDSRQIYFVNQIIEYIVQNGMLLDLSILMDPPFSDRGNITEVFADLSLWAAIRKAIDHVNANAVAA